MPSPKRTLAKVRACMSLAQPPSTSQPFPRPPCLIKLQPALATPRLTYDEIQSLSYKQVKGSGIANTCPVVIPANVDATLKV